MKPSLPLFLCSVSLFAYAAATSTSTPSPAGKIPSSKIGFDRDVRPILSGHCYKCHGPDAAQAAAGLRLDSFIGATKHLDDGYAILPGSLPKSRLLRRITDKDAETRMPPPDSGAKPLSPEEIVVLQKWILQGAAFEKHWSYIPPTEPKLPEVKNLAWCRSPIDRFVLTKLEESGLQPEPEADRNTLAMRAAETLTGLPPTQTDLERYRKDKGAGAYERFVDRLLSEPTYGENQARYWLDAVRYGDTHGLQLDNERSVFPYRDWVIKAFNQDLPFDKFAEWQLAGDLLPSPTTEQLVATGYVRMNLTSNEGGAIEDEFLARNTFDRVDTTSTVFLGLTVGCAKCHDHKYDPIKQKDYYGLYAYFNSTQDKPLDDNISLPPPVIAAPSEEDTKSLNEIQKKITQLTAGFDAEKLAASLSASIQNVPKATNWEMSDPYLEANFDTAFDHPEPPEPEQKTPTHWKPLAFRVEKDNSSLVAHDNASVFVRATVTAPQPLSTTLYVSSDDGVKIWLNGVLIHSHKIMRGLQDGIDPVKAEFHQGDNQLLIKVVNGGAPDGLNVRFQSDSDRKLQAALEAFRRAPNNARVKLELINEGMLLGPATKNSVAYRNLVKRRDEITAQIPMSLIAREMKLSRTTFVLKRGQYDQKGDRVERHIPGFLGGWSATAQQNRRGLADWLTSPKNPLVSRVFVNRVWQQHFGTGIVKTVEDFGSQGEWPVNQPLLDYLAVSFVQNRWSVKQLNRIIVTSAAFRQSSKISRAKLSKDPENRLISRGPRYRLDAEAIRDKALVDGGLLVEKIGGRGFKPYQPDGLWEGASDPASSTHVYVRDKDSSIYRRSLYMFWKRTSPPPVMVAFDAPLRDSCIVRRSSTNTPLQALTTLNEPGFLEASRTMAQRLLSVKINDDRRLQIAFERTLGRDPQPSEKTLLLRALARYRRRYANDPSAATRLLNIGDAPESKSAPNSEQASWMIICSSLMNTDEFLSLH